MEILNSINWTWVVCGIMAIGGITALAAFNRPLIEQLCRIGCIMLAGVGMYILVQQIGVIPPLSIAAPQIYFEGMDASPRRK
jgi:hypothetical protein